MVLAGRSNLVSAGPPAPVMTESSLSHLEPTTDPVSNPYAPPDPNKPRPQRPPVPPRQQLARPPSRVPEPPPQLTPEQVRSVTSRVMLFGLAMLATLLANELPMPIRVLAPLVGVGAFVYGLRTLSRVRALRWRGMLTPMLIGGLVLTGLTTTSTTTQLTLFWDELSAYQECRDRALTIAAQDRCERERDEAMTPSQE